MVRSIIKKPKKIISKEQKKTSKHKVESQNISVVEKSKNKIVQQSPSKVKKDQHPKEQKKMEPGKKFSTPKIPDDKPVADTMSAEETSKPILEIGSLKELENKILEKFEENKVDVISETPEEPAKHIEPKIIIKTEPQPADTESQSVKMPHKEDTDYKARVEAILFAVGKYLDDETISQLCDMDKRHTKKALEDLKKEYDARDTALMVVQEGNSWKINVREKYLSLVRKIVADTELSKSIMETLAVIAWKTPVYQNEIVRIRGNKCYDHIEELVNSGMITKDKKGRSYVLKTTDKFYNYFDIDRKNLQGIMNEAKMPVKQTTLDEASKTEEVQEYSREKLLHALETIETKSIVQTEEDKAKQKEFLANIHQKIEDASRRTDEVVSELPRPMHEQENQEAHIASEQPAAEDIPPPLNSDVVIEKNEEDIVINTEVNTGEHHFQKPEDQIKKTKSLTKKQLEKKFKEELQRVKEKVEDKKK